LFFSFLLLSCPGWPVGVTCQPKLVPQEPNGERMA